MAKQGILFENWNKFYSLQQARDENVHCYFLNILFCSELKCLTIFKEQIYFKFGYNSLIILEKPLRTPNLSTVSLDGPHKSLLNAIVTEISFSDFIPLLQKTDLLTPDLLVKFDKLLEQHTEVKYEGLFVSSGIPYIRFNFGISYNLPVLSLCDDCIKEIL